MFIRPEASTLVVKMRLASGSRAVLLEARLNDRGGDATAHLKVDPHEVTQTTAAISRMSLGYGAICVSDSLDPVKDLGAQLFDLLFDGPLSQAWYEVAAAEMDGRTTRIVIQPEDDLLATYPWELMFDRRRGGFVALSPRTPVLRRRVLGESDQEKPVESPAVLRVLPISADADGLADADADERTFDELQRLFGDRLQVLPSVEATDLGAFASAISAQRCDVVHFSGTGNFAGEQASVKGRDLVQLGRGRVIELRQFADVLQKHPPTLLFLSSDNSAAFARELAPFVPFVIGLQGLMAVENTTRFERVFYRDVMAGRTAGGALTTARQALHAEHATVRDWGLVVAYSQQDDLRLVPQSDQLDAPALPADVEFAGHAGEPVDKDAARQWARLHRRMEILGTNLSALKARPIKSKDVEDQIRDTTQQLESLTSELRSLGTRNGS